MLRAHVGFLLAGAGLILLNAVSPVIASLLERFDLAGGIEHVCILNAAYYFLAILLPFVLYTGRGATESLRLDGISFGQMMLGVAAALLCVLEANAIAGVWTIVLETLGFTPPPTTIPMNDSGDLMTAVIAIAVMPGICEELLFRGVVLTAYERGGTRRAIILSSVLFATLHGSIQGLPVQLLIGILLGYAAAATVVVFISAVAEAYCSKQP